MGSASGRAVGVREIEILARAPLFASLPEEDVCRLASLLCARRYGRGEIIFLEGDDGSALCLIAEGRVRMQVTSLNGREVAIKTYGPGEIFGELALLDGQPRSTAAIAQVASRVFWLQRDAFTAFLVRSPHTAIVLLAELSRRLRHTTRVVQDAPFRDVPSRIARVLLDLADRHGRCDGDGIHLDVRVTQGELATRVGAARETVNRAIRGFEQQGILRWAAGGITILLPSGLRAQAERA